MRICSLLPSATEIVFALGLGDQLVAVTHECDYPAQTAGLPIITRNALEHEGAASRDIHNHIAQAIHQGSSIYHLDAELLRKLDPDIILTQELCHVCAVAYTEVQKTVRAILGERKVVSLEPTNLDAILDTIIQAGDLLGASGKAAEVVASLRKRVDAVARRSAALPRPRVFAMEWLDPAMAGGHWVPQMVSMAGGEDVLGQEKFPSFVARWEEIAERRPEVVVLMPCGFDQARTVEEYRRTPLPDAWRTLPAVQSGRVYAVNGSAYFNRPGPRIVDGLEMLAEMIHPEAFSRRHGPEAWQQIRP